VTEYRRDGEAAGALDIHEEASRTGHERFEFVLFGFGCWGRVEEIDCEDL
jgi:hypothetical protein